MFSFERFARLNQFLLGFYRIMLLNLLWVVVVVAGLGVFGVGPASYALAKYLDRWFRCGELPPTVSTFFRYALECRWQPVLVSWILLAVGAVIGVNLLSVSNWYLWMANVVVLAALVITAAYVYFVMSALHYTGIIKQLSSALLIGLGSLHWTIIGATVVTIGHLLMFRFAMPLLFLVGVGLPAAVMAFIVRNVFRDIAVQDGPAREQLNTDPSQGIVNRKEITA